MIHYLKGFVLLTVLFLTTACRVNKNGMTYNLDHEKETLQITTLLNKEATFVLQTNPSTGYSWQTNFKQLGSAILVVTDSINKPDHKPGWVGVPSNKVYTLKFLQKGVHTLEFNYLRVWEKGIPPVKQKTVVVTVE